jgi:hypothetical protein
MTAALEGIIVVALAFLGMGYFIHSLMIGAPTLLTIAGGLGLFAAAWIYGMLRTG